MQTTCPDDHIHYSRADSCSRIFRAGERAPHCAATHCPHRSSDHFSSASGAIGAGFALQSFDALFPDDGNHNKGRRRIGPPQTEKEVED
jgi:hypothetical protein